MKLVYMGTPDFAVAPLETLAEAGCDLRLVVTQPDRPRDRGKRTQSPPVKLAALRLGLPTAQPESIKENKEFIESIREIAPDLIVVAAYGRLLPAALLAVPRRGCVNIHASILPKFRGAAPIQNAILAGETETGVSLMYMAEKMDAGDVIAVRRTPVGRKTASELLSELSRLGAALLRDTLPALEAGTATGTPQNDAEATYAPPLERIDANVGHLDFSKGAAFAERTVRATDAGSGAYVICGGARLKVLAAEATDEGCDAPDGVVVAADARGVGVAAGGRIVRLTVVQSPGKRPLPASEWLRGRRLDAGTPLE